MHIKICTVCSKEYSTNRKGSKFCSLVCAGKANRRTNLVIDGVEHKQCTKCNKIKPLFDFPTHHRFSDGHNSFCKDCKSAQKKEHWAKTYIKKTNRTNLKGLTNEQIAKHKKEVSRRYYEKTKSKSKVKLYELRKEDRRLWRARNKDKIRVYRLARKTKKKNAIANFSVEEWEHCKQHFNYKCAYCGSIANNLTQDHFYPLSKGGEYTKENIIPACHSCNSSKSNKNFFEWYKQQSFYDSEKEKKILKYLHYKSNKQQLSILF